MTKHKVIYAKGSWIKFLRWDVETVAQIRYIHNGAIYAATPEQPGELIMLSASQVKPAEDPMIARKRQKNELFLHRYRSGPTKVDHTICSNALSIGSLLHQLIAAKGNQPLCRQIRSRLRKLGHRGGLSQGE